MIKKNVLVIVPHPDDELLVGGGLLKQLNRNMRVHVCYITTGDYYAHEGMIRMREAIKALAVLGIEEKQVFFLGYGDEWIGKHIYNSQGNEKKISHANRHETYGLPTHPEYCFMREGCHHEYTRNNLKKDLYNLILELMPEIFLVVDFDVHADHRAVSLIFEECMGTVLHQTMNYTPLVLKKFAYLWGGMRGPKDYYFFPTPQSKSDGEEIMENYVYEWEKRIALSIPEECNTPLLTKNLLYKAAKKYRTQVMWYLAMKYCNADMVFWRRKTDSILYHANISVSSGNGVYLNDFQIVDCDDIVKKDCTVYPKAWYPAADDKEKKIFIQFDKPQAVSEIVIYEGSVENSLIRDISISIDDRYHLCTGELVHNGTENFIHIPRQENVKNICLQITEYEGSFPGISELEVYDNIHDLESYDEELKLYGSYEEIRPTILLKAAQVVEKYFLELKFIVTTRIFPNKYILMRRYSILIKYNFLMPLFVVWNPIRAILKRISRKLGYKGVIFNVE